jgi:aquaporin SIP
MEAGFAVEAALVMVINLVFLFLVEGGAQRSPALARYGPHATPVLVCLVGSEFTGPSLNPAFSFAWNRVYQQHSVAQHVAVFWCGPLTGAVLSALLWRALSGTPAAGSAGPPARSSRDRAAGRAAALALSSRPKAE